MNIQEWLEQQQVRKPPPRPQKVVCSVCGLEVGLPRGVQILECRTRPGQAGNHRISGPGQAGGITGEIEEMVCRLRQAGVNVEA